MTQQGSHHGSSSLVHDILKEGANTSWTFLRPDLDPGEEIGRYQCGKGSVPVLKATDYETIGPSRRTVSTVAFRQPPARISSTSSANLAGFLRPRPDFQRESAPRRAVSLCDDQISLELAYRYNWEHLSLPGGVNGISE